MVGGRGQGRKFDIRGNLWESVLSPGLFCAKAFRETGGPMLEIQWKYTARLDGQMFEFY